MEEAYSRLMFFSFGNDLPLYNMEFFLIGDLGKPNHEIQQTIQRMGGTVSKKVHQNLTAIISNTIEVQRMSKPMKEAKKNRISVVPVAFLDEVLMVEPISFINNNALCDWGHDVGILIISAVTMMD